MDIRSHRPAQLSGLMQATAAEARSLEGKLGEHVEGEVLVKLRGDGGMRNIDQDSFADSFQATVLEVFDTPHLSLAGNDGELIRVRLPKDMTVAQALVAMARDERVAYVAPNDIYRLQEQEPSPTPPAQGQPDQRPNDLVRELYGLHNTGQDGGKPDADIDAPEAWQITTGQREGGPVIAVVDTGVDYNHPDLRNNLWTNSGEIPGNGIDDDGNGVVDDYFGYNAYANTGDPMDGHSHGTHCAGTIGAEGNNGQGVVGVNWQARIMPVKIFNDQGSTTADAIIRGLSYATKMGARITSNSWGGGAFNQAIYEQFQNSPALHIIAAGNNNSNNDVKPHYPGSYDLENIVAVAATDRRDQLASFSCYGATTVDLAAPGVDIYSTMPGGKYANKSGTSMATPHVSGVAGLIASAYPEASNAEIKSRLMAGADRLSELQGKMVTGGRLNAANSLENDSLAPEAPNDFRVGEASSAGALLNWTAVGDDGLTGRASSYDLRFSDRPIVEGPAGQGQVSFEDAAAVATAAPSESGSAEAARLRLTPSSQERHLYVALKVRDNVGNTSPLRTLEVNVPPAQLAFSDSLDNDNGFWAGSPWGRVAVEGRGQVLTDSPNGNYASNADVSVTSQPISLAGYRNCTLMFDAKTDLENGYDKVFVEASRDGQNWSQLASLTGKRDWSQNTLDLSAYDGQPVQLRFRLKSDNSVTADGIYLDQVAITGDRVEAEG